METDPHARSIVTMRDQLETHFKARQDVYVAGSMALYYRRGDSQAVVVPDVFAVLRAAQQEARKSYLLSEEGGVAPSFVVEVASPSTSRRDATSKRAMYERMGVHEYWRFDPLGKLTAGRLAATSGCGLCERLAGTGARPVTDSPCAPAADR